MSCTGVRDPLAVKAIAKAAKEHGLEPHHITGPLRIRRVVRARRYAAWLMRHLLNMPTPNIGYHLGQRDHTTVLNMLKKLKEQR